MRRMVNKRITPSTPTTFSSLVHIGGPWTKGHMLHVFFEKKCVLSLVISLSDVQTMTDSGVYKRALEPTQMIKVMDFVDYDEETTGTTASASTSVAASATSATSAGKQPKQKKSKTSATTTSDQQQQQSSRQSSPPPPP